MLQSAAAPHRRKTTTYTRPDNTLASRRPKRATRSHCAVVQNEKLRHKTAVGSLV
jgi:hypothetical protein